MKVGKMQLLINDQTREAIGKLYQVVLFKYLCVYLVPSKICCEPDCINRVFDIDYMSFLAVFMPRVK